MDDATLDKMLANSEHLKKWAAQFEKKRYLYKRALSIGKDYFPAIAGMRGIGKTVMLLQLANATKNSVYFSADSSYLRQFSLHDIISGLRAQGFANIFVDEIHTAADWPSHIKTIYDEHEVRVFFSGSSSMKIKQSGADLSRRAVMLDLSPVSFREYLYFSKGMEIPACTIGQILQNKKNLALKYAKAQEFFGEYMRFGGVMYSQDGFFEALQNSLEKIITSDLSSLRSINAKYESDIYLLLHHIASSKPYEFSYNSVAQKFGISKTFLIKLLADLQRIGLVKAVAPCRAGGADVKKEPKVYLSIPYRRLLCPSPDIGAMREEFFISHAPASCYYKTKRGEKTSDFRIGGKTIEVGGISKKALQNPDIIATDSLRSDGIFVPLFLFGLLY